MSIVVRCECGKEFHVPDEHAGKSAKCRVCGAHLTIPARLGPIHSEADPARSIPMARPAIPKAPPAIPRASSPGHQQGTTREMQQRSSMRTVFLVVGAIGGLMLLAMMLLDVSNDMSREPSPFGSPRARSTGTGVLLLQLLASIAALVGGVGGYYTGKQISRLRREYDQQHTQKKAHAYQNLGAKCSNCAGTGRVGSDKLECPRCFGFGKIPTKPDT